MKYNKIFLGIGVMGLALTSCSEDLEYTPAEPVNTPPVYFGLNDENEIDLEEDAVYFTIPVYRQDTSGSNNGEISLKLAAEDGSSTAGLFTIGTVKVLDAVDTAAGEVKIDDITDEEGEPTGKMHVFVPSATQFGTDGTATFAVDFPAGAGEGDVALYFGGVGNLTRELNYNFDVKAAGEASPYFITAVDYTVNYTPWETITEGPVVLRDYTILAPSTAGREIEFEVTCQKHPKKDFFRLIRPYADCGYGSYTLDMNDPNYLYVNAQNPTEVFFSDRKGNYQKLYDTGVMLYTGIDGNIFIACGYCYNKLQEDFEWEGYTVPYSQLSGAGTYANGRISFGSNLLVALPGNDYAWPSKGWTLIFPWAPSEWEDLGEGTYTDGFIDEYFGYTPQTYPVTVQQHTEDAGRYRILGPYAYGVWPSVNAIPWDMQFNLVFDCSDPDFVLVEEQTIFEDETTIIDAMNADYCYQYYLEKPMTKDELISEGYNDKFENNVITIAHPIFFLTEGEKRTPVEWFTSKKFKTPAKLVLPELTTPEEAAAQARAHRNNPDVSKIDFSSIKR